MLYTVAFSSAKLSGFMWSRDVSACMWYLPKSVWFTWNKIQGFLQIFAISNINSISLVHTSPFHQVDKG